MYQNDTQSPTVDRKMRWAGFLERPRISMVQRAMLDTGRVEGLKRALASYRQDAILEVGCGLGECSRIAGSTYVGIDNSLPRIRYAQRRYPRHRFLVADARALPFDAASFDLAMLIDTSHHLTDDQLRVVLAEMKRVSRRHLAISDPVFFENQGRLSSLVYRLDRGACIRSVEQMRTFLAAVEGVELVGVTTFRTFPGLYVHATFVLAVTGR